MIKNWINNNIKNATIIEAGMYNGADTFFLSNYAKIIYGFEPIPILFDNIKNNIEYELSKQNVKLINKALHSKTGKYKMFFSDLYEKDWGSSSILRPKEHLIVHPEVTFKTEIEIDAISLDDFIEEQNIEKIDFIWFDVQGSEYDILSNSKKLNMIDYIYTEVSLIETYDGVKLYPEFRKYMEQNNFSVVFENLPYKDMGDVLFKNNTLYKKKNFKK